jgi:formate hydrogenlyase subunit 3/multisubunit Na+/H+ antiporter MnhD subunit
MLTIIVIWEVVDVCSVFLIFCPFSVNHLD